MLSRNAMRAKATIKMLEVFDFDYIKKNIVSSTECMSEPFDDGKIRYFVGFKRDSQANKWLIYISEAIDTDTGKIEILDYRLPNGNRMESAVEPILCS